MSTDEIDSLLERHLHLLDQYTSLRSQLSTLQSSVSRSDPPNRRQSSTFQKLGDVANDLPIWKIYQNIARANFSTARGIRYGQDYYDERMRATRHVQVALGPPTKFTITSPTITTSPPASPLVEDEDKSENDDISLGLEVKNNSKQKDPIQMFGILTPPSLRQAQSSAIQMIEQIVPKLASVDAEMKEMEIQIRRARKHFAKSEGRAAKLSKAEGRIEEVVT